MSDFSLVGLHGCDHFAYPVQTKNQSGISTDCRLGHNEYYFEYCGSSDNRKTSLSHTSRMLNQMVECPIKWPNAQPLGQLPNYLVECPTTWSNAQPHDQMPNHLAECPTIWSNAQPHFRMPNHWPNAQLHGRMLNHTARTLMPDVMYHKTSIVSIGCLMEHACCGMSESQTLNDDDDSHITTARTHCMLVT